MPNKLFSKIDFVLKNYGARGLFLAAVNFFSQRLFGLKIVKSNSIKQSRAARKIFKGRAINKSSEGYYFLSPMPTEDELNIYYENIYWDSRAGKDYHVNKRDLLHFNILKNNIPHYLAAQKSVLNFGAGHGGTSHLFWLEGMNVCNVEPSSLPQFYEKRWNTYQCLSQVKENSIDLFYSSHSLEHVPDIDEFKKELKRVLKKDAFCFFEVPNAKCPDNGAQNNIIDIPHTYYFTTEFFQNWFSDLIVCKAFQQSERKNIIDRYEIFSEIHGPVIRVLGKLSH